MSPALLASLQPSTTLRPRRTVPISRHHPPPKRPAGRHLLAPTACSPGTGATGGATAFNVMPIGGGGGSICFNVTVGGACDASKACCPGRRVVPFVGLILQPPSSSTCASKRLQRGIKRVAFAGLLTVVRRLPPRCPPFNEPHGAGEVRASVALARKCCAVLARCCPPTTHRHVRANLRGSEHAGTAARLQPPRPSGGPLGTPSQG